MQELFHFIMSDSITDVDSYLGDMQKKIANRPAGYEEENQVAEGVFLGAPVIRRLDEVEDYEKEQHKLITKTEGYQAVLEHMTVQKKKNEEDAPSSSSSSTGVTSSKSSKSTISSHTHPHSHSHSSAKPSAKPVSAPTVIATGRDLGASQLFAGLLLPQAADQIITTNAAEPGYVSGEDDEEDEEDEDDDEEEEEEEDDDLPVNLNHTEAGGRRVMTHVRKDESDESEYEDDDDDEDDEDDSDGNDDHDSCDDSGDHEWVERPVLSAEEIRAARKAAKKEVKAAQREVRKTKMKKKDKKQKMKKGKK